MSIDLKTAVLRPSTILGTSVLLVLLMAFVITPVIGEEVKGRWRFELQLGGTDPGDSIRSKADNVMLVENELGGLTRFFDPRPSEMVLFETKLDAEERIELRAGYGFYAWKNSELVIDFGVGYSKASIKDIKLAFSLDRWDADYLRDPDLRTFEHYGDPSVFRHDGSRENWFGEVVDGGDMKMIPLSVNALFRFRPTKRLNPYVGIGVGYLFVDFEESERWGEIADQLDASCVAYVIPYQGFQGRTTDIENTGPVSDPALLGGDSACTFHTRHDPIYLRDNQGNFILDDQGHRIIVGYNDEWMNLGHDLQRPQIETPDTVFMEVRAGMEWQWRPKTAFFVDANFSWAAEEIVITVDGREEFGEGVTPGTFLVEDVPVPARGAPAYITTGGLVYPDTDGVLAQQPGEYIIEGGRLDYGGWKFVFGVRFTL